MPPAIVVPTPGGLGAALWGWLPQGDLAFDVGAHLGVTLYPISSRYARVVALEPAAEAYSLLHDRRGAYPKVTFLPLAASGHEGTVSLSVREFPLTQGMLTDPDAPQGASERLMGWWTAETGRREVPCTTLDALAVTYGTPAFVKIDTEGGEDKILRGAAGLLAAGSVSWQVEFHSPQLRRACLSLLDGYRVTWVRNPDEVAAHGGDAEADETGWLLAAPQDAGTRCAAP